MLSQATMAFELANTSGDSRRLPVNVAMGTVWKVRTVAFSHAVTDGNQGQLCTTLTHNLSLSFPTGVADCLKDEQVWAGAVGAGQVLTIDGYLLAGDQLVRVYNPRGSTAEILVVVYYELLRVSQLTWTWLRDSRSREE